jgi:hypothetical protein
MSDLSGEFIQLIGGRSFPRGVSNGLAEIYDEVVFMLKHVEEHAATIMRANSISETNLHIKYINGRRRFEKCTGYCKWQTEASNSRAAPSRTVPIAKREHQKGFFWVAFFWGGMDKLTDSRGMRCA